MRFLRHSLTGLLLAALTAAVLLYAGQIVQSAIQDRMARDVRAPQQRERVFTVNVVKAKAGRETPELTAFGSIRSRRTLDIRAASGGTVIELADAFVEGGRVEAGQVLVRIDPADAQSALDRTRNDVLDAMAETRDAQRGLELARDELSAGQDQVDLRERALQRQSDLLSRGVGTAAAHEAAELAVSSARQALLARRQAQTQAEARVDQASTRLARANLTRDEAERRLKDTTIRAEFAGALSQVSLVKGGLISPNERLAALVDDSDLEVAFRVSTQQYARLLDAQGRLGTAPVSVTLDVFGVDLTAQGQLTRDSAAVGEGQTGRLIFAGLDQAPGMKPGDFVTVTVHEPPLENVVRLPSQALNAKNEVLLLGPEDRLQALRVELLRRQGDEVLVAGSPQIEGREIVSRRSPLLGAGIKVKPLRQGAASVETTPQFIELSADRRARLLGFVQASARLSPERKARLVEQLQQDQVPARVVERIEARMGG